MDVTRVARVEVFAEFEVDSPGELEDLESRLRALYPNTLNIFTQEVGE
jgi:hypothetical protein